MYNLARKLLFSLPPETAHHLALRLLALTPKSKPLSPAGKTRVMGIDFSNPVGIAAGLDKNGEHLAALSRLGCGFVEIGTVTPQAQAGNTKPRLFRLTDENAIINRMGFNNDGLDKLLANIRNRPAQITLGINIGKNRDTDIDNAADDYLQGLNAVYTHADYVTVNISSPNTPGLRQLQSREYLAALLGTLKARQLELEKQHDRYVPLAVKLAPDMSEEEIAVFSQALLEHNIDAVIATNTTVSREKIQNHPLAGEDGGLSGAPLFEQTNNTIAQLHGHLQNEIPIIACGGITKAEHAVAHINAGAKLVQLYTGFIYRGPTLIKETINAVGRE